MTIQCKTFPNEQSARGALNAAEATWTRPTYTNIGTGYYVDHSILPTQKLAEPDEVDDGTWVIIADHPSMKGDLIDHLRLKKIQENQGQGNQAQAPGQLKKK